MCKFTQELLIRYTSEEIEEQDNEAIRIGHDLENYVAQRFTEATGLKVRKSNFMYRSTEHPFTKSNTNSFPIICITSPLTKTIHFFRKTCHIR